MKTGAEWSNQIKTNLKIIDPDISAEPLTVESKIIDAAADVMAQASTDQYVLSYAFDIDAKAGSDLDKFAALFGRARFGAKNAQGIVTFSRSTPATDDVIILPGVQVQKPKSSVSKEIRFVVTEAVVLPKGGLTVDAPVTALTPGVLGNVPANTITDIVSGTADVSTVTNSSATVGGADQENDADFRIRFKNTIFRNVAGTNDQYLALAVASNFATKARVLGAVERYAEYLQIPHSGSASSEIIYSKYTYPFDYYMTDGDPVEETFFTPRGVQFNFNDTVPPSVVVTDTFGIPPNTVVRLEHSYCSKNSRNDPANNVNNYIDVYVAGDDEIQVQEATMFPDSTYNFVSDSTSPFYNKNFRRNDNTYARLNNRLQELLWQPVSILPNAISIGNSTYFEGIHYWFVRDITVYRGSKRARNGIEWASYIADNITAETQFVIEYSFNRLSLTLNELMNKYKNTTADVLVHIADNRFFTVSLTAMYTPGFVKSTVDSKVFDVLSDWFNKQDFGAIIQISDITEIVHEVPGIDNVRLTVPTDGVAYGIQEVALDGVTPIGLPYTGDFLLEDKDLPVLASLTITQKSQNTWT